MAGVALSQGASSLHVRDKGSDQRAACRGAGAAVVGVNALMLGAIDVKKKSRNVLGIESVQITLLVAWARRWKKEVIIQRGRSEC